MTPRGVLALLSPLGVTPRGVLARRLSPLGVTPRGVLARRLSPLGVTPRGGARTATVTPGVTPLGVGTCGLLYARFLAITAVNPLTIVSFAAVAAGLSLDGPAPSAAVGGRRRPSRRRSGTRFSPLAAGQAGRWITPRVQRGLAIGGRIAVLAIAAHLALAV